MLFSWQLPDQPSQPQPRPPAVAPPQPAKPASAKRPSIPPAFIQRRVISHLVSGKRSDGLQVFAGLGAESEPAATARVLERVSKLETAIHERVLKLEHAALDVFEAAGIHENAQAVKLVDQVASARGIFG